MKYLIWQYYSYQSAVVRFLVDSKTDYKQKVCGIIPDMTDVSSSKTLYK